MWSREGWRRVGAGTAAELQLSPLLAATLGTGSTQAGLEQVPGCARRVCGTRDSPARGRGSGRAGGRGRWHLQAENCQAMTQGRAGSMGRKRQEWDSPAGQQRPLEAQPRAGSGAEINNLSKINIVWFDQHCSPAWKHE